MSEERDYEILASIITETDDAMCVEIKEGVAIGMEFWVPHSVARYDQDFGKLIIEKWFADQNCMV